MTGAGHGNKAQKRAEMALRRAKVAEEYRKKKSTRQIAEILGYSHMTVVRDVEAIIAERQQRAQTNIEVALANELAAYDASEANMIAIAEDPEQPANTRINAEQAIKGIRSDRAKVLGLYAAQRVELTGKDGGPISVSDYRSELASVLAKVIAARGDRPLPGQLEPEGAEAPGDGLAPPPGEG